METKSIFKLFRSKKEKLRTNKNSWRQSSKTVVPKNFLLEYHQREKERNLRTP